MTIFSPIHDSTNVKNSAATTNQRTGCLPLNARNAHTTWPNNKIPSRPSDARWMYSMKVFACAPEWTTNAPPHEGQSTPHPSPRTRRAQNHAPQDHDDHVGEHEPTEARKLLLRAVGSRIVVGFNARRNGLWRTRSECRHKKVFAQPTRRENAGRLWRTRKSVGASSSTQLHDF